MSILAPSRPPAAPAPTAPPERPNPFAILATDLPRGHGGGLGQSLPSALEALKANKGRAVLTTLGIIIGVAAVIVMVALGQGASAQVAERPQGLGTNVLTIPPGSPQGGGGGVGAGSLPPLPVAD